MGRRLQAICALAVLLLLAACASARPLLAPKPTRALRKALASAEVCAAPEPARVRVSPGFRYGCFCGLGYPGLAREMGKKPRDMSDEERVALIARYYAIKSIDAIDGACQAHDVCWIWNGQREVACNEAFRATLRELRGEFGDDALDRCQRLAGDMTLAADSVFAGGSSMAARVSSIGVAAIDAGIALTGTLWNADRYPHPDERCDPGPAP